ncbi:MAG: hypothetical protein KTR16_00240, partial [Acidiferrobacterales bacterium]|nr:hypothetical protein [Acidiferrobacterales bacterium]
LVALVTLLAPLTAGEAHLEQPTSGLALDEAGSSVAMTGHTVVEASSMQQAIEFAKTCPFLNINGTLDVAELVEM